MDARHASDAAVPGTKVLAYLHTFNDADVIDGTIEALCRQTYPLPKILLIDNASTDNTLQRPFPDKVTIIRNADNLGTSGAVAAGMEYAIAHGYQWIYILDADSAPEPLAIENLLRCYHNLSPELQRTTWWLSSFLKEAHGGHVHHGSIFTPDGVEILHPPPQPPHFQCHSNMWSGSMYRLDAVKDVGLPDRNYVLDWGDMIYGYEGLLRGYTGFIDQSSIVLHNLHPLGCSSHRWRGGRFNVFYSPPIRSYYFWRNTTYFWLYKHQRGRSVKPLLAHLSLFLRGLIKTALFIKAPGPILRSYFRGVWDGLHARLETRY
jgi:rhamnosyltransferase